MTQQLWRLSFLTSGDQASNYADALDEHLLTVSWFPQDEEKNIWVVEGTLLTTNGEAPETKAIEEVIAKVAKDHSQVMAIVQTEKLPDQDWLAQTWANFPPLEIGCFYLYGSHNKGIIPQGKIALEINAATAFGSGEHETTRGCLMTLQNLKEEGHIFQAPLDMGCGSGILAMGIAKLWNVRTIAVDNDPEAVRVSLLNAQLNGCNTLLEAYCYEGFQGGNLLPLKPFDLIVANILANPLCNMAKDMLDHLAPGGIIVLSGLLARQRDLVLETYKMHGATLKSEITVGDWITLCLTK